MAAPDERGVAAALVALAALAWAYLFFVRAGMSADMGAMSAAVPMSAPWAAADFVAMFAMWAVMMIAMMLPSVTPVAVLYARTVRRRDTSVNRRAPGLVAAFVGGYLIVWAAFSAAATLLNWVLHQQGLLSAMMGGATPRVAGGVLIAAGAYQWTPLKDACLAHCRSPVGFLADHWREGRVGALGIGVDHGVYCLGCCWLLMALLFAAGVMNLVWIAVLTVFVLAEKVLPAGGAIGRAAGALLVAWGVWLLVTG